MDLHAGTVQLGLENSGAAKAVEGVGDVGGGLGEHRADRPAHLQGELFERGGATGQRGVPRRQAGPAEHRGPAHHRQRGRRRRVRPRRPSPRSGRPAAVRRRAGGAGTVCSIVGRRGEKPGEQFGAPRLRALARTLRRSRPKRGIDVAPPAGVGSPAGSGGERSAAHPTPICRCGSSPDSHDTTTATSRASIVGAGQPQHVGEAGGLGEPRRGRTDVGGRTGDVYEQHPTTLARSTDTTSGAGLSGRRRSASASRSRRRERGRRARTSACSRCCRWRAP